MELRDYKVFIFFLPSFFHHHLVSQNHHKNVFKVCKRNSNGFCLDLLTLKNSEFLQKFEKILLPFVIIIS